jgi:hypothetical protein
MRRTVLSLLVLIALAAVLVATLVWIAAPRLAFFPLAGEDVTPERFGVRFEAQELRTSDGERLQAWWMPHEQPRAQVVYFHGNGGNLSVWSDILVEVRRRGFDVLAIDYRGYGLSTGSPSETGLYRDADAALEHLHSRLRRREVPLIYWGRSLGTPVAAYATSRHTPDGVILEAGFSDLQTLLRDQPVMWALSWFTPYRFPTARWMQGAGVPALVLHGTRDSVIPFAQGQRLFDRLEGEKRFFAIAGGDHNDSRAPDAEAYWQVVHEFVSRLPRR